jgi:YHS domain-containing protein
MWLRLLIGFIAVYLLYRLIAGKKPRQGPSKTELRAGEELVQDPICHAYVPISHAHRLSIDGKVCYFCGTACLEQYKKEAAEKGQGRGRNGNNV